VNFITAHDGFTLNDLVSYNDKHNDANGEDNKDGHGDNRSFNYGVEGPTDDDNINAVRDRQKRNFLATLLLSHGTPMLLAGDEFGRSQMGNNNGYCQDSDLSWVHWENLPESAETLRNFTKKLIELRQSHSILRRENWRDGMHATWLNPGGGEQTQEQWNDLGHTSLGLRLTRDNQGDTDEWQDVLILFNPYDGAVEFKLPDADHGWMTELTTADPDATANNIANGEIYTAEGRSLVLLRAA
jgi:glycogen operon protein